MTRMVHSTRNAFCDVYRATVFGFDNYVLQIQTCCWEIITVHTHKLLGWWIRLSWMAIFETLHLPRHGITADHAHYRIRKSDRHCMPFKIRRYRLIEKIGTFDFTLTGLVETDRCLQPHHSV